MSSLISGGYCDGVPPLPIPNREVKPVCADGTAMQCGRVGSRLLLQKTLDNRNVFQGLFLFSWLCLIIVAIVVIVGYSDYSSYSNDSNYSDYSCNSGYSSFS